MATLYDRLGGSDGIRRISSDLIDLHLGNPRIAKRFAGSEPEKLKNAAATFFITGSGGPNVYEGKDMVAAHKKMNIDNDEFVAVLDDALVALQKNAVAQREQEEVLYILYSMKQDVVGQ